MESIESRFETTMFARYKSGILLLFFDALKRPDQHESVYYVEENVVLQGLFAIRRGVHNTAEHDIIDQDVPTKEKSAQILYQFQPVAKALKPFVTDKLYPVLVTFCDENMDSDHGVRNFSAMAGTDAAAEDILPPAAVIDAMYEDTILGKKRRCRELERYIDETCGLSVDAFV